MALRYKIKAAGRKYLDPKTGEEKTMYLDIGAIMDGKSGGFVMKLEVIPTGWDGFAFLSEPEARPQGGQRGGAQQQRRAGPPPASDPEDGLDDIPF